MHVRAKKIAVMGLLAAFVVILVSLGAVIETNTLYFLVAASYCIGIVIREWGIGQGCAFWLACVLLCAMIAPNKVYGVTFAVMGLYLLWSEWLWQVLANRKRMGRRSVWLWMGRYGFFNLLYLPVVFGGSDLLFAGSLQGGGLLFVILAGQVVLWIYELAYQYVQQKIWGRIRGRFISE